MKEFKDMNIVELIQAAKELRSAFQMHGIVLKMEKAPLISRDTEPDCR